MITYQATLSDRKVLIQKMFWTKTFLNMGNILYLGLRVGMVAKDVLKIKINEYWLHDVEDYLKERF